MKIYMCFIKIKQKRLEVIFQNLLLSIKSIQNVLEYG